MDNANTGVSMEQVFQIIAQMNEQSQKNVLEAIQEFKRLSPEDQEKRDKEKARDKQRAESAVKLAMAEEQAKENRKRGCPHGTTHEGTGSFRHAWRAQVHTPHGEKPYFVPTCMQCLTQLPKILATAEQLQNGVNLDKYKGLDLDQLQSWAKQQELAAA